MRSNSAGPYLLMLPGPYTHFEYWDRQAKGADGEPIYSAFVHSTCAGAMARAKDCNWREPHTSLTLSPPGHAGDRHDYDAHFQWADDYRAVRDAIVAGGLIDVEVVPGMTVPSDLVATIALRTSAQIHGIDAEHFGTVVEPLDMRAGRHLYRVRFARLGESRTTHLEFFVTEPIETLIRKRGEFIARHQHRDPPNGTMVCSPSGT